MKYLILFLFSFTSQATELIFVNHTNEIARITFLSNKCLESAIISDDNEISLKVNQSYIFKDLIPVVHVYTICGSGLCTSSAIGFKDSKSYTLDINIKDGIINGDAIPDHWVGNLECPK